MLRLCRGAVRLHVVIDFIVTEGGESDFGGDSEEGSVFAEVSVTPVMTVWVFRAGLATWLWHRLYRERLAVLSHQADDVVGSNKERIIGA